MSEKWRSCRREFMRLKEDRIILENMAVPALRGKPPYEPPVTPEDLEAFFTGSPLTRHFFSKDRPELYNLSYPREALVTFDPKTADEKIESVTYLSYGSDLFRELLAALPKVDTIPDTQARVIRIAARGEKESTAYFCKPAASSLVEIMDFQQLSVMIRGKNDLRPLTAQDLSEIESTLRSRVETAMEREREALESYEAGKLRNLRAECRQVLDDLVAIEMEKRWAILKSETDAGLYEAGTVLRRLLRERRDRVPALLEAATVDVEQYVLPPEVVAKYAGMREDFLDGSKGPLVRRTDNLLQSIRLLIDKTAEPRQMPSLETIVYGMV